MMSSRQKSNLSWLVCVAVLWLSSICENSNVDAAAKMESRIISLTDQNFKEVFQSKDFWLIDFYAPWCGHCKTLEVKVNSDPT